jgi:hypothetical protein
MTIEALMVNGAEERVSLLPSKLDVQPRVLAEPQRRYVNVSAKNPFLGIPTLPPRLTENRIEVLRFVRLTTLSKTGSRWEGFFYDQAKGIWPGRTPREGEGIAEKMVNAEGARDFTILDKYGTTILKATVVYIDGRQLVFRADGKFYRLGCGDFLYPDPARPNRYPAMKEPLKESDLKELGLSSGSSSAEDS